MRIILRNRPEKFLSKQERGDFKGIAKVRLFLSRLEKAPAPTLLPNAKKMKGREANAWRWRVGSYRIVGMVWEEELIIEVIEISSREDAYK